MNFPEMEFIPQWSILNISGDTLDSTSGSNNFM